ncbi:hypothetical protein CXIVA_21200 [Clostridium sp. SY8519]|uniref:leucine-rich repeat protein n=1 Tax=Clostridium sp. (strain SY8519) TaxID=1042156 RepID=UPI0002171A8B|nr:leucine-rich repeat protein [Clostridium sp. SY8519]BAK48087.1 hypothetical protein CXIVA_21200 [Clostridium sp. SY8519]
MKKINVKYYWLLFVLSVVFSIMIMPCRVSADAEHPNQEEAIAWVNQRAAESWCKNLDNFAGCQCVDLIQAYYNYLVGSKQSGNAIDYASNTPPDGWKIVNGSPRPGDVVVWGKYVNVGDNNVGNEYTNSEFGHIGIVTAIIDGTYMSTVETNTLSGPAASTKTRRIDSALCFIRPKFDFIPPEVTGDGKVILKGSYGGLSSSGNSSGFRFNLSFTVTDNCGIDHISVLQREFGQNDSQLVSVYELSCTDKEDKKKQDVVCTLTAPEGIYYYKVIATDEDGNSRTQWLNNTVNLYEVRTSDTGTYKVTADKAVLHLAPWAKVNGKSTNTGVSALKGTKLDVIGSYTNPNNGHVWYQIGNERWIYSERVKKCSWFSNFIDGLFSIFGGSQGGYSVERVVYTNGQVVDPSSEDESKSSISYRFVDSAPDEIDTVDDDGNSEAPVGSYKVSFDANGGVSSASLKYVKEGNEYGTLPTASRSGYSFAGWYTKSEGGTEILANSICEGDITLYAQWSEKVSDSGSCGENLTYNLRSDGTLIISGSGAMTSAPWYTKGLNKNIVEVILPDGLTSIYSNAFSGSNLYEIVIPSSVTKIGASAFSSASGLQGKVTLSSNITDIEAYAFSGCSSLEEIEIRSSKAVLGRAAFRGTSGVQKVTLPADIKWEYSRGADSGADTFLGCGAKEIVYTAGETGVMTDAVPGSENNCYTGGVCYGTRANVEKITFEKGITHIGNYTCYCSGSDRAYPNLKQVNFPEGLESIGEYAFYNAGGTFDCTLPSSLKEVGQYAFSSCGITGNIAAGCEFTSLGQSAFGGASGLQGKVTLSSNITDIGAYAFSGCSSLEEIEIRSSKAVLGRAAFRGTSGVQKVTLPADIKWEYSRGADSGADTFLGCGAKEIVYTAGETGVMTDAVPGSENNCYTGGVCYGTRANVEKITFEKGITHIGNYTCYCSGSDRAYPNLKQVNFPEGLESIGEYAFYNAGGTFDCTLPSSLKEVGQYAFSSCGITGNIAAGCEFTSLGQSAFGGASGLQGKVTLSSNITDIGAYAFSGCSSLEEIEIRSSKAVLGRAAFRGTSGVQKVTLPADIKWEYSRGADSGADTFLGCGAKEIVYTAGETGVMTDAVPGSENNCYTGGVCYGTQANVEKITFEKGITHIGNYTCYYSGSDRAYPNLKQVNFPEGLESIGEYAFYNAGGTFDCTLPSSLKEVGQYAFSSCGITGNIAAGCEFTSLGQSAFGGASGLQGKVTLSSNITDIGAYAFSGCSSLEEIEIRSSKAVLGRAAFRGTSDVQKVTLPADIKWEYSGGADSGADTFLGCGAKEIVYTAGETGVMTDAVPGSENNCYTGGVCYGTRANVEKITFAEGITHIGNYTCYCSSKDYPNLKQIILPDSLTSIGSNAFYNTNSLTAVQFPEGITTLNSTSFYNMASGVKFYGYKGTRAESYASEKNYTFVPLYDPEISGIADSDELKRGETYQLSVSTCTGIDTYTDEADWSIEGQEFEGTTIDQTGKLVIDPDEMAEALTITASVGDHTNSVNVSVIQETYQVRFTGEIEKELELKRGQKVCRPTDEEEVGYQYSYVAVIDGEEKTLADENWELKVLSDITVQVSRELKTFTVTFIPGEGHFTEEGMSTGTYGYGAKLTDMPVPVRDDYDFAGWYTSEAEEGEEVTEEDICKSDMILYAHWTPHVHQWDEGTVTTEATCTETGTMTYTCACGETKEESIEALGHDYQSEVTTEAGCTEEGELTYTCSRCEDHYTEPIPAKGHIWNENYTVDKEATCLEEGSESIHCSVCDTVQEGSERVIEKGPHTYGEWVVTKEATCTDPGSREKTCTVCSDKVTEEIAATGHDYGEWISDDESGHTHVCANDASHKETESHTFDAWKNVKEATYEQTGLKERICTGCGYKEQEEIPKLEKTADQKAADVVAEKIQAIGAVTLNSKKDIEQARSSYNALTADQKKLVNEKTVQVLTDAESRYAELEEADGKFKADQKAAGIVAEKIQAIGPVTLDSKTAIEEARSGYDALTDAQKDLVTSKQYAALVKAEKTYAELKAADEQRKADQKAVAEVIRKINAIGTVTLNSKATIETARKAYNTLSDSLKGSVTNYEKLKNAEMQYSKLTVISQKIIVDNSITKIFGMKPFKMNAKTNGDGKLSYVSSDKRIATVSSSGIVTIKGVGTARIIITATQTEKYKAASETVTIKVLPKGIKVAKLTGAKKSFSVKWSKQPNITGYRIQYSTSKSFKKGSKYKIIKKYNSTSAKISKLKKKKKYYIRIQTYKTIGGKKYYSNWSQVKAVKTK